MKAYVVETTAVGQAGISVLEVVGPGAQEAFERAFGPDLIVHGRPNHTALADHRGEVDDVVVALRPAEVSMTGWPHVEIQCHGSPAIVKRIRRALILVGIVPAPRTFLLRTAVRNRRMTRLEEEAWLASMSALTDRAAKELWEQRTRLPELAKRIGDTKDRQLLDELQWTDRYGRSLSRPFRVAVVGEPNVGKSSLINALAGHERVLVDVHPGTTRDVIEVPVSIDGVPFILMDTAGSRHTVDPVEQAGMTIARRAIRRSHLVIHLRDANDGDPDETMDALTCWAKGDLHPDQTIRTVGTWVSTVAREGLAQLRRRLVYAAGAWDRKTVEGAFLFTRRQVKRVRELLDGPDSDWTERWEKWVWGRAKPPQSGWSFEH